MKMLREQAPGLVTRASSKALPPPSQLLANLFRNQALPRIVFYLAVIQSIMRQVIPAIRAVCTAFTVIKTGAEIMGRLRDGFVSSAAAASAFSGTAGTIGGKLRTVTDAVTFTASSPGVATWGWLRDTTEMIARKAGSIAVAAWLKTVAAAQRLVSAARSADLALLVVIGLAAVTAASDYVWAQRATFRKIVIVVGNAVWGTAGTVAGWIARTARTVWDHQLGAFSAMLSWVRRDWPWIPGGRLTGPAGLAVVWIINRWRAVQAAFAWVMRSIKTTSQLGWDVVKLAALKAVDWVTDGSARLHRIGRFSKRAQATTHHGVGDGQAGINRPRGRHIALTFGVNLAPGISHLYRTIRADGAQGGPVRSPDGRHSDTAGLRARPNSEYTIRSADHRRCGMRQRALQAWPLWSILAAQSLLTVPWLWRTAPFTDEARYLAAGHKEWAHWLHHTMLPDYGLSGAPVLYPPMGAAADSAGGLAAARGLSLILMLGATAMVYLTGSRLFGRWAAIFASAFFAVVGLVVHYGAFATYDALALFFLVLGAWAAVHVREGGYRWIAGCAVALVVSNAAKYATLAWVLVVVGIVALHSWDNGVVKALRQACVLAVSVAVLDVGLLAAGGPNYVHALFITTVFRSVGWSAFSSPASVLWRAFAMTGVLVLPAALGPIVSVARRNPLPFTCLLGLLVLAALIAPIDQAHLHQLPSLDKNMGFGLPFAALGAGYAISAGIDWLGERFPAGRPAGGVVAAALIILALVVGREQTVQFRGPSSTVAAKIISAIQHGYKHGTYIALDGAPWMEKYYLRQIPARAWMGIFDPPAAQRARFGDRICAGRISIVILKLVRRSYYHSYDFQVQKMMEFSQRYRLAVATSQGAYATQVWRLKSRAGGGPCG